MNIQEVRWWLLGSYVIMGQLAAPAEGAGLELKSASVGPGGTWNIELNNVPERDQEWCKVTLCQQLEGGNLGHIIEKTFTPCKGDSNFKLVPDVGPFDLKGDTKVVKAKIEYPDTVMMKSQAFDMNDPTAVQDSDGTLEWMDSIDVVNGDWKIKLKDVPSPASHDARGSPHTIKLYQQFEGDKWKLLQEQPESDHPDGKKTFTLTIPGSKFDENHPKIVMAEVAYAIPVTLESKTFDLGGTTKVALIVGCAVGGVCLIALVVGCIWYKKRGRRPVPLQQPVTVMGQGQGSQTTQATVMVHGQSDQVHAVDPQNQV